MLCAEINSASELKRDGKQAVAYELWGENLVLLMEQCRATCLMVQAVERWTAT